MYHTCTHICTTKRIHCIHLNQEGFVVLNILYLALHAIYCVMAVRLIRNYEITTEDDYYARNSVFLLASRLREMEKKSKSCSLTWHFTKHCSIRHKQNAGTRIRFRLLSATDRDEQVAGRRDFNKPEAHCVRVLERRTRMKAIGKKRMDVTTKRYNEEAAGWSEHGESQPWGLYCCRAMCWLWLARIFLPLFITSLRRVVKILKKFCIFF